MTKLYQSKGRIPVCWSAGRSPEAPRLTPGCGVLVGRSPAASSPASRCSSSKRRESSRRSRCGAETRCRPEETGDKTKAAPRRRLAETLGTNASRLGLWDDGVTHPVPLGGVVALAVPPLARLSVISLPAVPSVSPSAVLQQLHHLTLVDGVDPLSDEKRRVIKKRESKGTSQLFHTAYLRHLRRSSPLGYFLTAGSHAERIGLPLKEPRPPPRRQ